MTTKQILLAAAISSLLAACGSSSSQGTVDTSSTTSSTDSSSTDSSSTDSSSTDSSSTDSSSTDSSSTDSSSTDSSSTDSSSSLSAAPIKLVATKSSGAVKSLSNYTATADLNQLVIDGKTIDLIPVGFSVGQLFTNTGTINGDSTHRVVSGSKFASKFGVVENGDEIIAFSQGTVTATSDMPTSGSVSYEGRYAGYNHDSNQFANGDITATADFGNKTLDVTASEDSNGVAGGNFSATISGNTFSATEGDITAEGQFYGSNAEEMGGVFNNTNYTAAFGAIKQ